MKEIPKDELESISGGNLPNYSGVATGLVNAVESLARYLEKEINEWL